MNKNIGFVLAGSAIAAMAVVVPVAMAAGDDGPATATDTGTTVQVSASTAPRGTASGVAFAARRSEGTMSVMAAAAEELGMTVEELRAALATGQSILDVAEAQGLDAESFTAAVVANIEADIDAALAAGELTDDEAAALRDGLAERVAEKLASTKVGGRHAGGCDDGGSGSESGDSSTPEGASTEA